LSLLKYRNLHLLCTYCVPNVDLKRTATNVWRVVTQRSAASERRRIYRSISNRW